jgi:MoxR-like ATPase
MQPAARSGSAEPSQGAPKDTSPAAVAAMRDRVRENVARAVLGQEEAVDLCLAALLADGHILLEDVPGVGKTTLARALAQSLGLSFSRIQFTSDLLPSDIVGSAVPERGGNAGGVQPGALVFQPGPIFASVVLADELNRTTPRTQSSLLEAMADRQVTVDGTTHPLPKPFLVIATQNPIEHHGTYPLPESQLDRFAVRLSLGYPGHDEERRLLLSRGTAEPVDALSQVVPAGTIDALQTRVGEVRVDGSVADYVLAIATATRKSDALLAGASTRATLGLTRLARAQALLQGRDFVTPADVKRLVIPALAHRLVPHHAADPSRSEVEGLLDEILSTVPVPD